jgi:hypothetical protein
MLTVWTTRNSPVTKTSNRHGISENRSARRLRSTNAATTIAAAIAEA